MSKTLRARWGNLWANSNFWTAAATVIIAVATIVSVCVAARQWSAMVESNKINRNALESVQRAFVTFSPTATVGTIIKNNEVTGWSAQIPMTNSGSTPTKGMRDRVNVLVSSEEMPKSFDFHDTGEASQGVLGPKDTNSYGTEPILIKDIQAVQHQTGHVYVYGWAAYRDVFPETKLHLTQFCYELHLNTIAGDLTDPKYMLPGRLTLCPQHNCTDDDCKANQH